MSPALLVAVLVVPSQLPGGPVIEWPVLPPAEDALRFPADPLFVREMWQRSEKVVRFFDSQGCPYPPSSPHRQVWDAQRYSLNWARRAWYQLDDVVIRCDDKLRRESLRNLREVLGTDLYYQGYMPPPWGEVGPSKIRKEW